MGVEGEASKVDGCRDRGRLGEYYIDVKEEWCKSVPQVTQSVIAQQCRDEY